MFQGTPRDVTLHLARMGRKVPKGENSIEYLIDVIQEYDVSPFGVEAMAEFARTGLKPPKLSNDDVSILTVDVTPTPRHHQGRGQGGREHGGRLHLDTSANDFDHSLRSPFNNSSRSWTPSHSGVMQALGLTPSRQKKNAMK